MIPVTLNTIYMVLFMLISFSILLHIGILMMIYFEYKKLYEVVVSMVDGIYRKEIHDIPASLDNRKLWKKQKTKEEIIIDKLPEDQVKDKDFDD